MIQYDSTRPSTINWNIVLLIAAGIIILVTLITIFFIVPKVAEEVLNKKIQTGFSGLNLSLG